MIWLDYAIAGVVSVASVIGTLKGYNQQAFSLVAACLALLVGLGFSHDLAYLFPPAFKDPAAKLAAAFIALYALTVFIAAIIRLLLGNVLKSTPPKLLHRFGGLCLGLLRGGLWATIIVILAGLSVLPQSPWWHRTQFVPPFQTLALWLKDHLPSVLLENIHYR
ncbi:CvpA family protein [Methylovulum psychrotolerans]|jgi:membrane protein required for colicin V production|uniref:Colicin V production CvpA n=1 Tax=Methylovulum psychrotolerans TaxID=1704499 RepID=A0A1Z4BY22_9GAMM|nr:CvpA family protein [Methylovulum psychrotolerans]ASF46197.1 colicin V production CvpA [Methylovulum psychrotolerans]